MFTNTQSEQECIPPLCVQPIAENAVRHGTMRREEGLILAIRVILCFMGR